MSVRAQLPVQGAIDPVVGILEPGFCAPRRVRRALAYAPPVLLVGLTGGIGSGKSTVAGLLAARGAVVLDADAVARSVVEPGTPALTALVERFGDGILAADGTLDRPALAALAFVDDASRKDLEAITHPAINTEFARQMTEAPPDAIVICDVPLLAESDQARARGYKVVIVVEAPIEQRLERLEARGVPRDDAQRRMAAQATDEERRALATHVIDNAGDLAVLERQVDDVWPDLVRIKDEHEAEERAKDPAAASD
jgi:dephospho-CoA kinase